MSRTFTGSANGSYGQVDKPIVLAPPFTVAGHFKTSTPVRAPTGYLWWLGKKESSADWLAVTLAGGKLGIEARSLADNYATAFTANSVAADTEQHFVATFESTSSREIILNDVPLSKGVSTATRTPAAPNRTCLGRAGRDAPTGGWIGELAYIAVWNRVLTADEKSALKKGANPQSISGLVEYHELDGDDNPEVGVLETDIQFAMTGAPKGTFNPTIQPYSPRADGLPFDPADLLRSSTHKWSSFTQTFGFPEVGHSWGTEPNAPFTDDQGNTVTPLSGWTPLHTEGRDAVRAIMAYMNTLGWNFTEVPGSSNPELTFVFSPSCLTYNGGVNGYAFYPTSTNEGNVFIRPDNTLGQTGELAKWAAGGRRYLTALHEIGHTVGLRHPTVAEATSLNTVMQSAPQTGGEPYATTFKPVDLAAMKMLYPTLGLPPQATAVTKHSAASTPLGKRLTTRTTSIAFDTLWTIPFTAGRKLMIAVSVSPEFTSTSFVGLTFGGQAGTFKGSNSWSGSNDAEKIAFYEFSTWPSTASQCVVTCDKNLWCGQAFYWTYSGQGSAYLIDGFANNASANSIEQLIATEPGSLILAVGTAQGWDMAPVGLVWTGGVLDGQGYSSATSTTTDQVMGAASKVIASGNAETPRFTFPLSDGRGILVCSIPPEVSGGPPSGVSGAGAVISVGDADVPNLQLGTNAKAVVLLVEIDRAAKKLRVQMDDGTIVEKAWTGAENAPSGQVIIGAPLSAGTVQNGSNSKILGVYGSTSIQTAHSKGLVHEWAANKFRPQTIPMDWDLLVGGIRTIDLSNAVKDAGQWGWEIVDVDRPNAGTVEILDDHRLNVDLRSVSAGLITFQARVQSLHPLAPYGTVGITIRARSTVITVPNKAATVEEDGSILIDVLAGTGLTLTSVEDPENGTTAVESNRIRFIPDPGFIGAVSFTYTAQDTDGGTGTGTVEVTVTEKTVVTTPVPDFTWTPSSGSATLTVKFTYTGTIHEGMELLWEAGGTNVSDAQDPEFKFYSGGKKSVSLTLTVPGFAPVKITKTDIITVTSGGTSPPPPPPPPTTGGSFPHGLTIRLEQDIPTAMLGKTYADNANEMLGSFKGRNGTGFIAWFDSNQAALNKPNLSIGRANFKADGDPAFQVLYRKIEKGVWEKGGGAAWAVCCGSTSTPKKDTGFRYFAMEVDVMFDDGFSNYWDTTKKFYPFKLAGLAGGLLNSGNIPTAKGWSDGQGYGMEPGQLKPDGKGGFVQDTDRGFSYRFQGTGNYLLNTGTAKPIYGCANRETVGTQPGGGTRRVYGTDDTDAEYGTSGSENGPFRRLHYGLLQPDYTVIRLTRGIWHTLGWRFVGNTSNGAWTQGNQDGLIEYYVDGVMIHSGINLMHRRYPTLAHTFWIHTFFGGVPGFGTGQTMEAGSPRNNYTWWKNLRIAADNA